MGAILWCGVDASEFEAKGLQFGHDSRIFWPRFSLAGIDQNRHDCSLIVRRLGGDLVAISS